MAGICKDFGPRADFRMLWSSYCGSPRAKFCILSVSTHGVVIQMVLTIDIIDGGDTDSE